MASSVVGPKSGTAWRVHATVDVLGNKATLYESEATGLRGLLLSTGEPLSNVHVVIATEADTNDWSHKDDGLPHTLEHAIFLGSELYPYKGILDKLANRSLADGTNAWTATDHTCYTLTTAGHEGALNLFPIYADHILYPCLTDSSFTTEVHHVNGKGEDKGVVYCEMQGRENTEGSLVDRAVLDLLYPNSGYSAETGGKMANLRKLTNSQVKRYHAQNYVPSNVLFVLSGTAEASEFLAALDEVEARVLSKPPVPRRSRPWLGSPLPPIDISREGVLTPSSDGAMGSPLKIMFPSEDEACGCVSLAWRAPPYHERQQWLDIQLVWLYLTDSAASPLQKAFVECADALCADIRPAHEIFTEGYHQVWFTEAAVATIDKVTPQFLVETRKAATAFDADRMRKVIRRFRRRLLEKAEREPTEAIIEAVVRHFLYGPRGPPEGAEVAALVADADLLPLLAEAEGKQQEEWVTLIEKWILNVIATHSLRPSGARRLVEFGTTKSASSVYESSPISSIPCAQAPCVAVVGLPSGELSSTMSAAEEAREKAQAESLGEEKLKALASELEAAIEYNEREISEDILQSVPIPSLSSVRPIPLLTIRGNHKQDSLTVAPNSGRGIPEAVQESILDGLRTSAASAKSAGLPSAFSSIEWAHIESAFLYVAVALDTTALTHEQRLYLPLLLELAFKLPTRSEDGSEAGALCKDDFVSQLQDETVSYSAGVGLVSGSVPQMIGLRVHLESSSGAGLATALKWIRRALFLTEISPADARMGAQRLANEIPAQIRDGMTVSKAISSELNFDNDRANAVARSPIRQQAFLASIIARLDEGGESAAAIADQLIAIRNTLAVSSNMHAFVAGDLTQLEDPFAKVVTALTPPMSGAGTASSLAAGGRPGAFASAITTAGAPRLEASPWPPACAASDVLSGAQAQAVVMSLSAIESSFLCVSAPGVGAYDPDHASLAVAIEYLTALEGDFWVKIRGAGLAYDLPAACTAAQQIIVDYATGDASISQVDLDGARSSLAYGIIAGTATKLDAAKGGWLSSYLGKQVDYDKWLLERVAEVTPDDVLHALKRYIVPIFDPLANISVSCPVNKLQSIATYFSSQGCNVMTVPEEKLIGTFGGRLGAEAAAKAGGTLPAPAPVPGSSKYLPGAFAQQFRCGCARCAPKDEPQH